MSGPRPRVGDLTPEGLELLALEHVEGMFVELRSTCEAVREQYHPMNLIKRHPLIAMGLASATGLLLVTIQRRKPVRSSREKAATAEPGLFDALLSGAADAAARALPGLVASWLAPKSESD